MFQELQRNLIEKKRDLIEKKNNPNVNLLSIA